MSELCETGRGGSAPCLVPRPRPLVLLSRGLVPAPVALTPWWWPTEACSELLCLMGGTDKGVPRAV